MADAAGARKGGGYAGKLAPASDEHHRGQARNDLAGHRRSVEEPLSGGSARRKEKAVRLRRMIYSLGWLTAMAVALGAPWKN
jgi:hypothetical protein